MGDVNEGRIKKNFPVLTGIIFALLLGAFFFAYRSGVLSSPAPDHGGAVPYVVPTSTGANGVIIAPLSVTVSSSFASVVKVFDGDTIEIAGGEHVRYIGIDAPEEWYSKKANATNQCFAEESKKENERLVSGKTVRLVKDVRDRDVYGRLLRYVYVRSDPVENNTVSSTRRSVGDGPTSPQENFVNDMLIGGGFAKAAPYPPDTKYKDAFSELEKYARENKKGLWSVCGKP
jgi:endonuclease YncB( thermonuclease family)